MRDRTGRPYGRKRKRILRYSLQSALTHVLEVLKLKYVPALSVEHNTGCVSLKGRARKYTQEWDITKINMDSLVPRGGTVCQASRKCIICSK